MNSARSVFACLTAISVLLFRVDVAVSQQPGSDSAQKQVVLNFKITDTDGELMPCRIHLQDQNGNAVKTAEYLFWRDHFVCDGEATLKLSPGKYQWQIERGPEFVRLNGEVDLKENAVTVSESVRRLVSLREAGWYSADMHVHRPVEDIELLMRAEDLDFAPVITWWNRPAKDTSPRDETTFQFDGHRLYNIMAGEDEREGGALLYFGLDRPLDLSVKSREFPSPMQFVEQARKLNPHVWIDIEKPFWWDVPTWLASGDMNSIGLANNHMCHSRMYENEAWGRPRDAQRLPAPRGNGYWTQEIYYHALNAGLRIPPSAGSASGVLPNPVGYNRVYVHLDKPFSRESFFEALQAGRSFVTNGPLLRVRANEQWPGATLQKQEGGTLPVTLQIDLAANDSIRELEVIHNGKTVKTIPCPSPPLVKLLANVELEEPGWFLVRAITDVDETFRFASTAPWYVESPAVKTRINRPSAQFFLDWVEERMERIRKSVTDTEQLRTVLEPHEQARLFWQQRVRDANSGLEENSDPVPSTSQSVNELPASGPVDAQPLLASLARLVAAMDHIGSPLPETVAAELQQLKSSADSRYVTRRVQELLDPLCVVGLSVRPNGAPLAVPGRVDESLVEQGWRTFLIKVVNKPGSTGRLLVESPNSQPLPHAPADEVDSRWMLLSSFEGQPLKPNLSGLELEYRILQIYSRDAGQKQALLEFAVSGNTGKNRGLLREWRFGSGSDGWHAMNQTEIAVKDGALHVTSSGNDPYIGAEVEGPPGDVLLRFWGKTDAEGVGQVFWWTKERPRPDGGRQRNFVLVSGREQLYEIPFRVEGQLAGVRIDPMISPGEIRIDWIDLISAERTSDWAKVPLTLNCRPATKVTFRILDAYGQPGFAKFVIQDQDGRIYPAQSKRLAPDFFFQQHIYRGDGEAMSLPAGEYTIECSRGPETIPETKTLKVSEEPTELVYRVQRWIDPSREGWWSGDHHIHAAGCLHYENPTQGVHPPDMIRHILGEDLKVGCCLTWGPCFDYQKRFFTGEVAEVSRYPYLLRYDVEVSGFGSHMSGHLNLLNLQEQIYPGGESKDHWPTLGLNTLRWAKRQGAVCGPAHSSIGLSRFVGRVPGTEGQDGANDLPHYKIPAYDGIGANEFVVDVTHEVPGPEGAPVRAVDFISAMNTERTAEWNMWYHVLNCGFRVAVSGETDFPCVSGERVGMGRVYAQVDGDLTFDKWVRSIADGRSYVSDASCHLLAFSATDPTSAQTVRMGVQESELKVASGRKVRFQVKAAALREGAPELPVELIVNGIPAAQQMVAADGTDRTLTFETEIDASSWVAVRVFPHAHTNPIYVVVNDQPIRASADSARWCLMGVDQCWKSKRQTYADDEQQDAVAAYDHARRTYQRILEDCLARRGK